MGAFWEGRRVASPGFAVAVAAALCASSAAVAAAGSTTCLNQPVDWLGVLVEVEGVGLYDMCHLDEADDQCQLPGASEYAECAGFALRVPAKDIPAWSISPMGAMSLGSGLSLARTPSGGCVLRRITSDAYSPHPLPYSFSVADLSESYCARADSLMHVEITGTSNVTLIMGSADGRSVEQHDLALSSNFDKVHQVTTTARFTGMGPPSTEPRAYADLGSGAAGDTVWVYYAPTSGAPGGTAALFVDGGMAKQWAVRDARVISFAVRAGGGLFVHYTNATDGTDCYGSALPGSNGVLAFQQTSCVSGKFAADTVLDWESDLTPVQFTVVGGVTYAFGYGFPADLAPEAVPSWVGKSTLSAPRHYFALGQEE